MEIFNIPLSAEMSNGLFSIVFKWICNKRAQILVLVSQKMSNFNYIKHKEGYQLPLVLEVIKRFESLKLSMTQSDALFHAAQELRLKLWEQAECPTHHHSVVQV